MIKRISALVASFLLSFGSLLVIAPTVHAAADTCVWTGGGSDDNFSTAANWSSCDNGNVPQEGDTLSFPANSSALNPVNDYTADTSFNSITFSGAATQDSRYTITGNRITLVAGISNTMTTANSSIIGQIINTAIILGGNQTFSSVSDDAYINVGGVISGTGNLTKSGAGELILNGTNTYTGTTTVSAGKVSLFNAAGLGATSSGTTTGTSASIWFALGNNNATISEPFTFSNDFQGSFVTVNMEIGYGPLDNVPDKTITLDGAITLTQDVRLRLNGINASLSNVTLNNKQLVLDEGSFGTLKVNGENKPAASPEVTTLTGDEAATAITVGNNQKYVIEGKRGATAVYYSGILTGTGTVATTDVRNGAKLAPGNSPGCLNTGNLAFVQGSTYEFEVGGANACSEYDQTKVTGTVTLGNGTLSTLLYGNFKPVKDQAYTIISNDGSDPVTGIFVNMPESTTFTVDGYVFRVSYVGGDGNDVVLTVVSVPAVPDTGFSLISSNPAVTLLSTSVLALGMILLARRLKTASR